MNAEAGNATADSYVTVVYADAYIASSVDNSSWPASTEVTLKEAALIEATRILDQMFEWIGVIASETQSLRWPRLKVKDIDGRVVSDTSIPKAIADATCALAYYILKNGGLETADSNLKAIKVGPIDMKFNEDNITIGVPRYIVRSLSHYGQYVGSSPGAVQLADVIRS